MKHGNRTIFGLSALLSILLIPIGQSSFAAGVKQMQSNAKPSQRRCQSVGCRRRQRRRIGRANCRLNGGYNWGGNCVMNPDGID